MTSKSGWRSNMNSIWSTIRTFATSEKVVYLTFDDGPDPVVTPLLLQILESLQCKASFFVVADQVQKNPEILQLVRKGGHAIGTHSWDHSYRNFFRADKVLRNWICRAHDDLTLRLNESPIGFRSPAGVITPPLRRVLRGLRIPLIHWNTRFFDTTFGFNERKGKKAASRLRAGDILLLHDGNCRDHEKFLAGVQSLVTEGQALGFRFDALPKTIRHPSTDL